MKRIIPYPDEGSEKKREVRKKTHNFVWELRVDRPRMY